MKFNSFNESLWFIATTSLFFAGMEKHSPRVSIQLKTYINKSEYLTFEWIKWLRCSKLSIVGNIGSTLDHWMGIISHICGCWIRYRSYSNQHDISFQHWELLCRAKILKYSWYDKGWTFPICGSKKWIHACDAEGKW